MSQDTPLDLAHRALIDPTAKDDAHRAYYGMLVAAELFVLLMSEASDSFSPQLIEEDGQRYALAFDREDRMAMFLESPQDYVSMSGRALIGALVEADLGLGINLGMDAATMLPPNVLIWIAEQIAPEIETFEDTIDTLASPSLGGKDMLATLAARLPILTGLADHAILAQSGREADQTLLLAIADVAEDARGSCAGAVAEALRLGNIDSALDVVFVRTGDMLHGAMLRCGLRFDLPKSAPNTRQPSAPGSDPGKPPILN